MNHPATDNVAAYAASPQRTAEGARTLLHAHLVAADSAARLLAELMGDYAGAQPDHERIEIIQIRLLETRALARRL